MPRAALALALAPSLPDVRRMSDLLHDRVVAALGDRFEVGEEIGRGGMAVVYRAREVRLRRQVALKVLPPDLAFRTGVRERFLREAQTAAQLAHPHVVPIYAADETEGVAWLAMALVDGETLGQRMERAPRVEVDEARRILAQVADALAYAHARGVVHRDVKPDNVLLDRATGRALVTDFGIARAAEEEELRLTITGVAVGSPAYMSPEQALGDSALDGRSDLYALGVVAYQLLAGELPFTASSATGMLMKHVGEPVAPLRARRAGVPSGLAAAVERALAKKPADRWPDLATFRQAILAEEPPSDARHPAPDTRRPDVPKAGDRSQETGTARARYPDAPGSGHRTLAADAPGSPEPGAPAPGSGLRAPGAGPDVPALGPAPDVLPHRPGWPPAADPRPRTPAAAREAAREAEREWKDHLREQRKAWKQRRRDRQDPDLRDPWDDSWRDVAPLPAPDRTAAPAPPAPAAPYAHGDVPGLGPLGGLAPQYPLATPRSARVPERLGEAGASAVDGRPGLADPSLERRVERFRGHVFGMVVLVAFLTWINASHLFLPPWVLFPALGISRGVRQRWRPLRAAGLDFWEVMLDGPARALARAGGASTAPGSGESRARLRELEREARRFRRRVMRTAILAVLALFGLVALAATGEGGFGLMAFIGLFGGGLSGVGALRGAGRLRDAGVAPRAVLAGGWREVVAAAVPRPRAEVLAEDAARLASDDVLARPYGVTLRDALDDRLTVRETMTKLADVDRALIPDVRPTVDALVERIAGLAQSLHRIDADQHQGTVAELDARLARARQGATATGETADQARTVQLLERQRASLADLLDRRARLVQQLESAQLALQNVKLDLLKLRSAGVGALGEVSTATQEARALSRDIQHALEAAAEVRRS